MVPAHPSVETVNAGPLLRAILLANAVIDLFGFVAAIVAGENRVAAMSVYVIVFIGSIVGLVLLAAAASRS